MNDVRCVVVVTGILGSLKGFDVNSRKGDVSSFGFDVVVSCLKCFEGDVGSLNGFDVVVSCLKGLDLDVGKNAIFFAVAVEVIDVLLIVRAVVVDETLLVI